MSNFISILTKAYYNNIIQETSEAGKSFTTMLTSRDTLTEADIAKVSSFGLKILGTWALVDLGFTVLGVMRKRSISVGRLFYAVASFFFAMDTLKASTNLREKYVADLSEKQKRAANPEDGLIRGGLKRASELGRHGFERAKQATVRFAEDVFTESPDDRDAVEVIRFSRVCQLAIKDTSIFEPITRMVADRLK